MRFENKSIEQWFFEVIDIKLFNLKPNVELSFIQRWASKHLKTEKAKVAEHNLLDTAEKAWYPMNTVNSYLAELNKNKLSYGWENFKSEYFAPRP